MKTTVELSDELLQRARKAAKAQGRSLRDLIEDGLRQILQGQERRPEYKVEFPTFRGSGFTDAFQDADWTRIREEIYRGHGGTDAA